MDWSLFRRVLKIFFGICLILISVAVLLYNIFMTPRGYEMGLGFIDLFIFLAGLLLTVFNIADLSEK